MKRILIVDDDETQLELFKIALEDKSYEVAVASNGREGNWLFRENPADVVITDIFMPVMDGYEFIREIRASYPKVKIIAISGGGAFYAAMKSATALRAAEAVGADASIKKPILLSNLYKVVKELID